MRCRTGLSPGAARPAVAAVAAESGGAGLPAGAARHRARRCVAGPGIEQCQPAADRSFGGAWCSSTSSATPPSRTAMSMPGSRCSSLRGLVPAGPGAPRRGLPPILGFGLCDLLLRDTVFVAFERAWSGCRRASPSQAAARRCSARRGSCCSAPGLPWPGQESQQQTRRRGSAASAPSWPTRPIRWTKTQPITTISSSPGPRRDAAAALLLSGADGEPVVPRLRRVTLGASASGRGETGAGPSLPHPVLAALLLLSSFSLASGGGACDCGPQRAGTAGPNLLVLLLARCPLTPMGVPRPARGRCARWPAAACCSGSARPGGWPG